MTDHIIICPSCGKKIPLTETLSKQIKEALVQELEKDLKKKELEIEEQKKLLEEESLKLEDAKKSY